MGKVLPERAFKQSISTIADEGVHQVLHNIGVQQRLASWPARMSEGLADHVAPTDLGKRLRWKGVGYSNDLRMLELSRHVIHHDRRPQALGIRETVNAETLDSLGYAKSWALVHFLSKRYRRAFFDYLRAVSALEPLAEPPDPEALLEDHFGSDYAQLELEMYKHLQEVGYADPLINQTHYVVWVKQHQRTQLVVTASRAKVEEVQRYNRTTRNASP